MERGAYTVRQIELLHAELNAVYERIRRELGEEGVSWRSIAESIEEAFENLSDQERNSISKPYRKIKTISLSKTDNFRKFCTGQSKTMEPVKLVAIDIWLTEKEDENRSLLTTGKLHGLKDFSKVAASLENFLYENNSDSPGLNADNFLGVYSGAYCGDGDKVHSDFKFILKIEESSNPHIAVVELEEIKTIAGQSMGTATLTPNNHLSGWIVLDPEDNLICYLKNIEDGSNSIYYLIAINESVFDGAKADCLIFLDRPFPSEMDNIEKSSDFSSYLLEWAKKNQCNLMKFQRDFDNC